MKTPLDKDPVSWLVDRLWAIAIALVALSFGVHLAVLVLAPLLPLLAWIGLAAAALVTVRAIARNGRSYW